MIVALFLVTVRLYFWFCFWVLIFVPWRISRYFFGPMDDSKLDRIRHVGRSLGALLCCGATGMLDYLGSGPDDDSPPDFFDPYSLPPFCVEQMKRKWRVLAPWCEEAAHQLASWNRFMVQAVLLLPVALVSVQGTRAPVPRELHENFKSRRGNKRRLDGNSRVLKESTKGSQPLVCAAVR